MNNILILCTGNSCRSQMAHGFMNFYGGKKVAVYSAGIETHGLNKRAVSIMQEAGIDISGHTSIKVYISVVKSEWSLASLKIRCAFPNCYISHTVTFLYK